MLHQVGPVDDAPVGNDRRGLGQLDRRVGVVTLADADGDSFAGIPFLLLRFAKALFLPFLRRQHALRLALDVDAGAAAEAQLAHEAGDGVDAHVAGKHIVVGIAGLHDGLVHVDHAVPALLVVAEGMAAESEKTRIRDGLLRRTLAQFQRRQRHEGLECRPGRVGAIERAIHHRLVLGGVERLPVRRRDAVDEQIRVVAGHGHQRQNAARRRLDGHERAAALAEGLFRHFLELRVECQREVVARNRRRTGQHTHGAAGGIDLDLLVAGLAVQFELVLLLQPGLAEMHGAAIVVLGITLLDHGNIAIVNAADVAQGMRGQGALRVLAEQARLDLDARKTKALGDETRHLLVCQARADGQRFEVLAFVEQLAEALVVLWLDVDEGGQFADHVFQVGHLARGDFQRIGGIIVRQHHAIAVGNDAAIGHSGHDGDAVVLGPRLEMLVLDHLQPEKAGEEQEKSEQHEAARHGQAPLEAVELLFRISELGLPHHQIGRFSSFSTGWYCGNSSTKVSGNQNKAPLKLPRK